MVSRSSTTRTRYPARGSTLPVGWPRDGTVNFRDDVYEHDEKLDRDALADVAAGGFVAR
jgi:hypothetical protein